MEGSEYLPVATPGQREPPPRSAHLRPRLKIRWACQLDSLTHSPHSTTQDVRIGKMCTKPWLSNLHQDLMPQQSCKPDMNGTDFNSDDRKTLVILGIAKCVESCGKLRQLRKNLMKGKMLTGASESRFP